MQVLRLQFASPKGEGGCRLVPSGGLAPGVVFTFDTAGRWALADGSYRHLMRQSRTDLSHTAAMLMLYPQTFR